MQERKQIRLKEYDYSKAGGYFITICTASHEDVLGKISDQGIELNETGEIAEQWWLKLENRFPNITLDYHVTMPNHIHGIIIMSEESVVGAIHELPLPRDRMDRRRMLIPKVIGYFKMNSAKHINRLRESPGFPLWQRNYYEHVIRNEEELSRIREYILNNPLKWDLDRENPLSRNFILDHKQYWKKIYN